MEVAVRVWQGQLRTIKHYVERKMGRQVAVDSALFSWLIVYVTEIMNKFKVGSGGNKAYANITARKCKHFILGVGEVVDYILETDKSNIHKADSRVGKGIFLGYIWRSTEYLIGTENGI